jgi:hypothetical protein
MMTASFEVIQCPDPVTDSLAFVKHNFEIVVMYGHAVYLPYHRGEVMLVAILSLPSLRAPP